MKEIIFITKFIPAPAYNGGAKRNIAWLRFLSKHYKVHVVGFYDKQYGDSKIAELQNLNVEVHATYFKRNILSLLKIFILSFFKRNAMTNLQYYNRLLKQKVDTLVTEREIEFILASELATMQYCLDLNKPIYFDDHNIEYILMDRVALESRLPFNLFYHREAALIKKFENKSWDIASKLFLVSELDKDELPVKIKKKSYVINNTFEDNAGEQRLTDTPTIMFLGNLTWKPNSQGMIHFMKFIFPKVVEAIPGVKLEIVGSNINEELEKLFDEHVILNRNASEELKAEVIKKAWLCIAPLYAGGGTRIKIIEYASHEKVVISTKIGAEGLAASPGIIIVNDDDDFANEIINHLKLTKPELLSLGDKNHQMFKANYDEEVVYGNTLYNTISTK